MIRSGPRSNQIRVRCSKTARNISLERNRESGPNLNSFAIGMQPVKRKTDPKAEIFGHVTTKRESELLPKLLL